MKVIQWDVRGGSEFQKSILFLVLQNNIFET